MRPSSIVPPLLCAALAATACDLKTAAIDHDFTDVAGPITDVVTELHVGDVILYAGSVPNAHIHAEAQWSGDKPALSFHREGGTVHVESNCGDDPQCRVDLTLTIPPYARVSVRGEETNISAVALGGAATLRTAVGDLDLIGVRGDLDLDVGEIVGTDGDIAVHPRPIRLHEPFDLQLGKTVHLGDERLVLQFAEVVEDSRCPEGASCVWAGRFIAALTLTDAGGVPEAFEVTLGEFTDVHGYRATLLAAEPHPQVKDPQPDPGDYVLTLELGRVADLESPELAARAE